MNTGKTESWYFTITLLIIDILGLVIWEHLTGWPLVASAIYAATITLCIGLSVLFGMYSTAKRRR